jgi:hypothetical protein
VHEEEPRQPQCGLRSGYGRGPTPPSSAAPLIRAAGQNSPVGGRFIIDGR